MLTFLIVLLIGGIVGFVITAIVAVRRDEVLKSEAVKEFVFGLEASKVRFGDMGIYVMWEDILDEMDGAEWLK